MITYRDAIQIVRTDVKAFVARLTANRVVAVLSLATAISLTGAVYFYARSASLENDPQTATQDETSKLVASVAKLILLPENETPTIATVSDLERLKDQPFFANAKNGDKVLIYSNSKKAILYDPVNNRIVEVAPINLGPNSGTEKVSQ